MKEGGDYAEVSHFPVMLKEVISALDIKPNGIYVDGTSGKGGHSKYILERLSESGLLIGIDRDLESVEFCDKFFKREMTPHYFLNDSYHNLHKILKNFEIDQVDGIILDLGLSSVQLESKSRGFTYNTDSDLDMRFDLNQKLKASNIVNDLSIIDLANIIYKYGEERRSRSIAKSIGRMRPLKTVYDLVEAIRRSTPPNHRNKSLSRVFQAIRIKVNEELKKLDDFLLSFTNELKLGGRIAIISFHSLEDRLVKHHFKNIAKSQGLFIHTKKPLIASKDEILNNKRSRSAKLRFAEKVINA
jgi:16S rRNA (cytosine1402-N4)-methyltransferase